MPDIVQAAQDALQIAATLDPQIDIDEVPLDRVAEAWASTHHRRRIVFTS